MKKDITIGFLLLFLLIPISVIAQKYTKTDINFIIVKIEKKLTELKKGSSVDYAKKDLASLDSLLKEAKGFLQKGKLERAYYLAKIADVLFLKVKAQKKLHTAKSEYETAKKQYTSQQN